MGRRVPSAGQGTRVARIARGVSAHASGAAAEERVADHYLGRGCAILARRWRSPAGEIDLVVADGDEVVFVEVKKSATLAQAAERLARAQMDRICMAALAYCERLPTGSLTAMRFDAALVDDEGRVEVIPNAFGG
ncbi:YraN family protein [uncultured Paracoccus sp.]|uniref:YraN family protein n=1 Tax=uncultured Paracoccus sp. TaxID=189685 RepID=UPI0026257DD9|nr:YraN family protein [uncultured Paracoccus sp.]